jgi:hypothetical protein
MYMNIFLFGTTQQKSGWGSATCMGFVAAVLYGLSDVGCEGIVFGFGFRLTVYQCF